MKLHAWLSPFSNLTCPAWLPIILPSCRQLTYGLYLLLGMLGIVMLVLRSRHLVLSISHILIDASDLLFVCLCNRFFVMSIFCGRSLLPALAAAANAPKMGGVWQYKQTYIRTISVTVLSMPLEESVSTYARSWSPNLRSWHSKLVVQLFIFYSVYIIE